MEQLVDMYPLGGRMTLDLVADDARPHDAVDEQQVGLCGGDLVAGSLEGPAQAHPALVLLGREQWLGQAGNQQSLDEAALGSVHQRASAEGNQLATVLPVPMTVP